MLNFEKLANWNGHGCQLGETQTHTCTMDIKMFSTVQQNMGSFFKTPVSESQEVLPYKE